jgi:hypothetical protein
MKPSLAALASLALVLAAPAAAQNSSSTAPGPPATGTAPATGTGPSSGTATPSTTPPETVQPVEPPTTVVVQPAPQAAPPPPPVTTIQPDVAYPNGFADPADPFANDLALRYQQREGFPWGLLGLLGLLGLIPLIRGNGRVRTVYVERDDEPRRVVRRERIEDE